MELDKVHQGDCIAGMRQLADESVDLIVTDPPYLMNYKSGRRKDKGHRFNRPIEGDKDFQLIHDYILECYRVLKPNSAAYVFCNQNHVDYFMQEARAAGFNIKNLIVWDKMNHTVGDLQASFGRRYEFVLLLNKGRCFFNGHRLEDIWRYKPVRGKQQQHQNQKPLELIIRCIEKHSKPGDLVLDGFMGAATTAVAAAMTGRHFIGWEIDPGYYEIAAARIASLPNMEEIA